MLAGVVLAAVCSMSSPSRSDAASHRARPAHRETRPAQPSQVVGRVVDALGNAVAGATVLATPAHPGPARAVPRTQSDQLGRFHFVGLPPGEYVFVALHGDHAGGLSPAMPVERALEVVLVLDERRVAA